MKNESIKNERKSFIVFVFTIINENIKILRNDVKDCKNEFNAKILSLETLSKEEISNFVCCVCLEPNNINADDN